MLHYYHCLAPQSTVVLTHGQPEEMAFCQSCISDCRCWIYGAIKGKRSVDGL